LPSEYGKMNEYDFLRIPSNKNFRIILPKRKEVYPHQNALTWHRENKFYH
jgi:hypothetical protein